MTPDRSLLDTARRIRERGLCAILNDGADGGGPATVGALLATGPDAARFLHAQLTNDVEGLAAGEGNATARVTRTGHLIEIVSLHRLPTDVDGHAAFLMLMERPAVARLAEELDQFLFADEVGLTDVSDRYTWVALQGPEAGAAMVEAFGRIAEPGWDGLASHAIVSLEANDAPEGTLALVKSLTGDRGYIIAIPTDAAPAAAITKRMLDAARATDLAHPTGEPLEQLLELTRIEAGAVRLSVDTPGRDRLLPETCLEQELVSYTKGCYIGQEVIARVRTYGSLPFALRGLQLVEGRNLALDLDAATRVLAALPPIGADLHALDEKDGVIEKPIGQIVSRTLSPVADGPVAFAYLDRTHRTPGRRLRFAGEAGPIEADVVLLPFHRAADRDARATALYDRAIRVFAEGEEERALGLLERALAANPTFSDAYEAVGVILGRSQRFEEAITIFQRLEEVAPEEPIVNTNLSLYYMKLGDKATAEAHAAKAVQKSFAQNAGEQKSPESIVEEQSAARRADAERKKAMFGQVLEIDAEDPVALFGLGTALATLEQWSDAVSAFERATAAQKNNSATYLAHGKALERLGRNPEAEAVYTTGIEVASKRGDLMPLKEMENRLLLLKATGQ